MELLRGSRALPTSVHPCVATIGNFDGLHRGHQALFQRVLAVAAERSLKSCAILFEPHPQEFFLATPPARLDSLREKLEKLQDLGVDQVLCLRFDSDLANMSAESFIRDILIEQLSVRYLVVGDDFRFGHERAGDFQLLQSQSFFAVEASQPISWQQQRVSSTAIRQALQQHQLSRANGLLGRPYTMSGRVVHGDKRGRTIGFPTANILLHRRVIPLRGVYAVRATVNANVLDGVANIGWRPTLNGSAPRLEVHLFDYAGDLYGQRMQVEFVAHIRDEQKFDGLDSLKKQIVQDALQARALLRPPQIV